MGSKKSNSKKKTLNIGSSSEELITIRGARQHNLKNVDLSIPRNKLVVFTGVSGSGKSSLAFDTILLKDKEDCLLYTSPSPRDQRGSRMPSSA